MPETTEAPIECAIPHWVGDNYCDDENNNEACGFDGGDCCDNEMDGWDNYCQDCACLESPPTTEPPMETTGMPIDNCAVPHWFGDGYCDDENNNEDCGFDGGDCCDNEMDGWDNYCQECECFEYFGEYLLSSSYQYTP